MTAGKYKNWKTHESALWLNVRSTDGNHWHDDDKDISLNTHVHIPLSMILSISLKIHQYHCTSRSSQTSKIENNIFLKTNLNWLTHRI